MTTKEKSLELKKHVGAIHSSNKLSLLQRKVANALLFNAYHELLEKDEHRIHIKDLCVLIGYDSKDYKSIKNALVNLLSTVIEWNLIDNDKVEDEGVWNASSIIADASIDGPLCTYSYSNKMKQLLYSPLMYGRLNMKIQARFKSSYGLALYENCVRYQNLKQTPWFDLVVFRKLMGVEKEKYPIFRDFKRRIIDKAVEEVNQHASITIMPKLKKINRQVVAIQFLLSHEEETKPTDPTEGTMNAVTTRLQDDFGFSKQQSHTVIENYSEEYILEKMAIIESSNSFRQGKISNLTKYLQTALEDNYQPVKSSQAKREEEEHEKQDEEAFKIRYEKYQHQHILQAFNQLSDKKKKVLLKDFQQYLNKGLYLDIFLRDGLSNLLIADKFCSFALNTAVTDIIASLMTYKEFRVSKKEIEMA